MKLSRTLFYIVIIASLLIFKSEFLTIVLRLKALENYQGMLQQKIFWMLNLREIPKLSD